MIRLPALAVALLVTLLPLPLAAETSRFDWTASLRFDPGRPLDDGRRLGDLMAELFGPGAATGVVATSGTVEFRTDMPPGAINAVAAGYPNAVTAMTATLGGATLSADLGLIAAHAATSRVGTMAAPGGGFCGDQDHCDVLGARVPGWGNQVVMLNDTPHVLKDETGLSDKLGDALGFMAGRTAAFGEFAPALQTASFGVVALDGLGVLVFSQPGTQLVDSLAVPHMRRYLQGPAFGRTEVWMFLEGQGWPRPIRVEGELTGLVVYP